MKNIYNHEITSPVREENILRRRKNDSEIRRTFRVSERLQGTSKIKIDKGNGSKRPYIHIEDEEQGDVRRDSIIEK